MLVKNSFFYLNFIKIKLFLRYTLSDLSFNLNKQWSFRCVSNYGHQPQQKSQPQIDINDNLLNEITVFSGRDAIPYISLKVKK